MQGIKMRFPLLINQFGNQLPTTTFSIYNLPACLTFTMYEPKGLFNSILSNVVVSFLCKSFLPSKSYTSTSSLLPKECVSIRIV